MSAVAVEERIAVLIEELDSKVETNVDYTDVCNRLLMIAKEPGGLDALFARRLDLRDRLDSAQTHVAEVIARLAASCLLLYAPAEEQPTPNVAFARGGPATEIALAALHLLRYAGDVVPLDTGDGPLEQAADPDFSDYQRVFGAASDHLSTAAYYLLDPAESRAALLSAPPEQETFPPLPFPRVWVEMTHLTPMLRLVAPAGERVGTQHRQLDLLGIAIAEVQQGRVWDIYLPFQFGDDLEFFFLAGRIAPNAVIDIDPTLGHGDLTFAAIRELAVGAIHLITARNAPPEEVALPRHQRKRLQGSRPGGTAGATAVRLYYVDLHAAGDHTATGGATGGREYHVRWLVRGHWRHVDGGRSFCTCCDPPQIATWVAAYIKGPAGAPWKGKQVHRG